MRKQDAAKRRFAVFDIDGTLIRWQLYHAVVDHLVKLGHLEAGEFEKIKIARLEWKIRSDKASFKTYEWEIIKAYEAALKKINPAQLNEAIDSVFSEYKDQVYIYTRQLITDLKGKDYLLFAISGSQSEIVDKIADYYGFESALGTIYEQKDNKFTGAKVFHAKDKAAALRSLVREYKLGMEGSLAIGDSQSDVKMLELVEQPIAFNPERELYEHAKAKGWKIVIERKNVVYELEKNGPTYLLA
jgi:HAD superfamily hydrolase (TIGR01490 family)